MTPEQKREIREQEKALNDAMFATADEDLPPIPPLSSLGVVASQSTSGEAQVGVETSAEANVAGQDQVPQQIQRVIVQLALITDILTALPGDIAEALGDI